MVSKCIKLAAPFFLFFFSSSLLADGIYCQRFRGAGRWGELVGFVCPWYWWTKIQAYTIPGTSAGKANSCNHTARSNLKWKLVPLDGLSVCRSGANSSSFYAKGPKLGFDEAPSDHFLCIYCWNYIIVDTTGGGGGGVVFAFKSVLSGQIRTHHNRYGASFLSLSVLFSPSIFYILCVCVYLRINMIIGFLY